LPECRRGREKGVEMGYLPRGEQLCSEIREKKRKQGKKEIILHLKLLNLGLGGGKKSS